MGLVRAGGGHGAAAEPQRGTETGAAPSARSWDTPVSLGRRKRSGSVRMRSQSCPVTELPATAAAGAATQIESSSGTPGEAGTCFPL